jgi:hypothetical protein
MTTTITLSVFTLALLWALPADAQTTCRPRPFGGGYTCDGPEGTTTIRPRPFWGGWNVDEPDGSSSTIRPRPFGGGYTIDRAPRAQPRQPSPLCYGIRRLHGECS